MRNRGLHLVSILGLLALTGCQLALRAFLVPSVAQIGKVFEIVVQADVVSTNSGLFGCVLQLPAGFQVVGYTGPHPLAVVSRDDPALLGLYTAESGHYLASWSGSLTSATLGGTLKVFVQAPGNPTNGAIKVSLVAQPATGQPYVANSPAGIVAFAQITASTHVRNIAVVADPSIPFVPDRDGLRAPGSDYSMFNVHLGDWSGDGKDDLITGGLDGMRSQARVGSAWTQVSSLPGVSQPLHLALGDFDGDGFADLARGDGVVFFGDGAGGWTAAPAFPFTGFVIGVAVGDVNGDGRDDVAFSGYYLQFLKVLLGNSNRTFTDASNGLPNTNVQLTTQQPLLRDVTGDGFVDLVGTDVWAGDGQGNWSAGLGIAIPSWGADAADLDGDGLPEIVCVSPNLPGARVYRHLGNNQWAPVTTTGLPAAAARSIAIADYDRDGRKDVFVGLDRGSIELWRNLGGMTFQLVTDSGLISFGDRVVDLSIGDINGDTFPDLAAVLESDGLFVWQNWVGGLSSFGSACQGTLPLAAVVQTNGAPTLGNAGFAVKVANGTPGSLGLVWLGTSNRFWSGVPVLPLELTPIGAPGCTVWTGTDFVRSGAFDAQGQFTCALPIPNQPSLLRSTLFAQGAVDAPGSNALDLALTAGLAIRLH